MAGDAKFVAGAIFKGALDAYLQNIQAERESERRIAEARTKASLERQRDAFRDLNDQIVSSGDPEAGVAAEQVLSQTGSFASAVGVLRSGPDALVSAQVESAPAEVKARYHELVADMIANGERPDFRQRAKILQNAYKSYDEASRQKEDAANLKILTDWSSDLAPEVKQAAFDAYEKTGSLREAYRAIVSSQPSFAPDFESIRSRLDGAEAAEYIHLVKAWVEDHPGQAMPPEVRLDLLSGAMARAAKKKQEGARYNSYISILSRLSVPDEIRAARAAWEETGDPAAVLDRVVQLRSERGANVSSLLSMASPKVKDAYVAAQARFLKDKGREPSEGEKRSLLINAISSEAAASSIEKVLPGLSGNPSALAESSRALLGLRRGTMSVDDAMKVVFGAAASVQTRKDAKDAVTIMSTLPKGAKTILARHISEGEPMERAVTNAISEWFSVTDDREKRSRMVDMFLLTHDIPEKDRERVRSVLLSLDKEDFYNGNAMEFVFNAYQGRDLFVSDRSGAESLIASLLGSDVASDPKYVEQRAKLLDPSDPNTIIGVTLSTAISNIREVFGDILAVSNVGVSDSYQFEKYVNGRFATPGVPIDPDEVAAAWAKLFSDAQSDTDNPGVVTFDAINRYAQEHWISPDGAIRPPVDVRKSVDWDAVLHRAFELGFVSDPGDVPQWVVDAVTKNPRRPVEDVLESAAERMSLEALAATPDLRTAQLALAPKVVDAISRKAPSVEATLVPRIDRMVTVFYNTVNAKMVLEMFKRTMTGSSTDEQAFRTIQAAIAQAVEDAWGARPEGYYDQYGNKMDRPAVLPIVEAVRILARYGHRPPTDEPGGIINIIYHSLPPNGHQLDASGRPIRSESGFLTRKAFIPIK